MAKATMETQAMPSGLPIMNREIAERSDVRVFLRLDGNVTIQEGDNLISLDEHQLKHVIELLQLARSELKNFDLGRF